MVSIPADSVEEYIAKISENRQAPFEEVRQLILENLPEGYVESTNWGMIAYEVPLEIEPDTYNGEPLMFCALAAQKRHLSLYMMSVYQDEKKRQVLLDAFEEMGVKPSMGKSCLRFTRTNRIPMAAIGRLIASSPMPEFVKGCSRATDPAVS
jgi:hypothetical protein